MNKKDFYALSNKLLKRALDYYSGWSLEDFSRIHDATTTEKEAKKLHNKYRKIKENELGEKIKSTSEEV